MRIASESATSNQRFGAADAYCLPDSEFGAPLYNRSARILIVEDLETSQIVIENLLRSQGHEVTVANNGSEALSIIKTFVFDLVLMDLAMPEMDGISATRMIRQLDERMRNIPVIALTADADAAVECNLAGMNDFLAKPVEQATLSAMVAKWTGACAVPELKADHPKAGIAVVDDIALQDLLSISGKDQVTEIVRMFRARLETMLPILTTASDHAAMARESHDLISIAGILGCIELRERARDLSRYLAETPGPVTPTAVGLAAHIVDATSRALGGLSKRFIA